MVADRDDRLERAASFAAVAGPYERARPGYPDDAVRWLTGETPCDVVDLGAGTGKLTRSLVALGHRVTAVEPLAEMLEELRTAVPDAEAVIGSAESMPAARRLGRRRHVRAGVPLVRPRARARRDRPCAPAGGRLALVWNTRDERVAWVEDLGELMVGRSKMGRRYPDVIDRSGLYGPVEHEDFDHAQELGREALRELVLSWSDCAVLAAEEREPVLQTVDGIFERHASGDVLRLPYVTVCFRATRL